MPTHAFVEVRGKTLEDLNKALKILRQKTGPTLSPYREYRQKKPRYIPESKHRRRKHQKAIIQLCRREAEASDSESALALHHAHETRENKETTQEFYGERHARKTGYIRPSENISREAAMIIVIDHQGRLLMFREFKKFSGKRLGFVFGGRDDIRNIIIDSDIEVTARRETQEEIGIPPNVGANHFIAQFPRPIHEEEDPDLPPYMISLYVRILPKDVSYTFCDEIIPNSEVFLTVTEVREKIEKKEVLKTHEIGFRIFEKSNLYRTLKLA